MPSIYFCRCVQIIPQLCPNRAFALACIFTGGFFKQAPSHGALNFEVELQSAELNLFCKCYQVLPYWVTSVTQWVRGMRGAEKIPQLGETVRSRHLLAVKARKSVTKPNPADDPSTGLWIARSWNSLHSEVFVHLFESFYQLVCTGHGRNSSTVSMHWSMISNCIILCLVQGDGWFFQPSQQKS